MISQWLGVREQGSDAFTWTGRQAGWSLEEWDAHVPAGDEFPGGCDHPAMWTSGGKTYKLCTNCVDGETPEACEVRHLEAVAYFKLKYPRDP